MNSLAHLKRYQFRWDSSVREGEVVMHEAKEGHWIAYHDALYEINRLTEELSDLASVGNRIVDQKMEIAVQRDRLLRANIELAALLRSDGRHTLDCDLVKHPNCTRCTCIPSVSETCEHG